MSPDGAAFADPWSNTHDPHEVTVQLDAVALRADNRLVGQAGGDTAEGSDGPVFVDESGRRSRRYRRIGIFVGLACAIYAVVIVTTLLSGNSNAPWLPVPGQGEGKEAGQVDNSPLPGETLLPTDGGSLSPGVSPSPSDTTTASPSAGATAPGPTATAQDPGTTADPEPTATKTTSGTGSNPTSNPEPTDPATSSPPEPTPTEEPTPDPTETPVGDNGVTGTDTVAGSANEPAPLSSTTPPPESTL
ncbi:MULTISPECIES: hypothetical protein [unclassified Streptomyces]|uniref:hypothetical protein n=1 Tax=unclassified Streptomyces TaxID=2593676 RepID=UPI0022534927|nr:MULTISPECIES: hypothetical protein [unclassified Streptomyces]MCX5333697.1 hypothetical protein [Streptomyces sp. NBC_00140]MCX5363168.1 hypothetical protein [Streptomyces sp. NBC_00124]